MIKFDASSNTWKAIVTHFSFHFHFQESNEKETFSPKRPLNAKAKEYLNDKKTTNRLTQSGSALTTQPQSPEKVGGAEISNFWNVFKPKFGQEDRPRSSSNNV